MYIFPWEFILAILQNKALIKCGWLLTSWSLHEGFLNSCAGSNENKTHFHSRKISTDRKFSKNIVKSWKFSTSKFFSDGKFVSANHLLQNFLSAENFPEWKKFEPAQNWRERHSMQIYGPSTCSIIQLHAVHVKLSISHWQCQGGTGCVVLWRVIKSNILLFYSGTAEVMKLPRYLLGNFHTCLLCGCKLNEGM
jgi:hypothetical protein